MAQVQCPVEHAVRGLPVAACDVDMHGGVALLGSEQFRERGRGRTVRTHAVAGNRGSSLSDVDLVSSMRLARVGCLFQSVLGILRAFHKKTYNASELPRRQAFPENIMIIDIFSNKSTVPSFF